MKPWRGADLTHQKGQDTCFLTLLGRVHNLSPGGGVEVEVGFESVSADSGSRAEKVRKS